MKSQGESNVGGKGDLLPSKQARHVKDWRRLYGLLGQKSNSKLHITPSLQESYSVIPQIAEHSGCWRQLWNTDGHALPSWNVHAITENRTVHASEKRIPCWLSELLGGTLKNQ